MDEKFEKERQRIIGVQKEALANQSHLAQQNLDTLDITQITPLDPDIISRQATQNIGTIGHVAHGKSTLVKAVSGVNVSIAGNTLIDRSSLQRKNEKDYY